MSGLGQQFYDDKEAEEILRLAASRTALGGGMSRDTLLQTAAELGITPEALAEAERQISSKRSEDAERKAFHQYALSEFAEHLAIYLVVNGGIAWFCHFPFWQVFLLGVWSLSIIGEAWETFATWTHGYDKRFRKWKRKRLKADEMDEPESAT